MLSCADKLERAESISTRNQKCLCMSLAASFNCATYKEPPMRKDSLYLVSMSGYVS